MSRIGKIPIQVPDGVEIVPDGTTLTVKGKLGELSQDIHPDIKLQIEDGQISVLRPSDSKKHRELHGLFRALIANLVHGVSEGYVRELNLVGVGYSADAKQGNILLLNLGYSHPIYMQIPEGITVETPKPTIIIVKGINKQLVGHVAAKIRSFRVPEPYKGKGIRYSDEYVRRKAGKTIGG